MLLLLHTVANLILLDRTIRNKQSTNWICQSFLYTSQFTTNNIPSRISTALTNIRLNAESKNYLSNWNNTHTCNLPTITLPSFKSIFIVFRRFLWSWKHFISTCDCTDQFIRYELLTLFSTVTFDPRLTIADLIIELRYSKIDGEEDDISGEEDDISDFVRTSFHPLLICCFLFYFHVILKENNAKISIQV